MTSTQESSRCAIQPAIFAAEAERISPGLSFGGEPTNGYFSGTIAITSISTRALGGTRPVITPVLATGLGK